MHYIKRIKRFTLALSIVLMSLLILINSATALPTAKNIILFIGDGMGIAHISLTRYYLNEDNLQMDQFNSTGYVSTHSLDSYVTDSAAAATAIACGYKTKNGMLSWLPDNTALKTVLESAQDKKKKVGLVSNTRITHATPAAFGSQSIHRDKENDIANQLLDKKIDVLLGGGRRHFIPKSQDGRRHDDTSLIEKAKQIGYNYASNTNELLQADTDHRLLGLFTSSHMSYELDRNPEKEPSLQQMTQKSLEVLSKGEDGFFLMVEGGRIDHAGHINDVGSMVHDLIAFDNAIGVALEYAKKDTNTLVIVTSDHECGGLGLSNGKYEIRPEIIENMIHSAEYGAVKMEDNTSDIKKLMADYYGIDDLTDEELDRIENTPNSYVRIFEISRVINDRAMVGWTTVKHSATEVPIMAKGPGHQLFTGFMDNTDIAEKISRIGGYNLFNKQNKKEK